MMIARWSLDARFGHKQEVIASLKKWNETFGKEIGWTAANTRILSGSVGVAESKVISEIVIDDLAALNASWQKLATLDGHAEWSRELEAHVVSGSNRWEIFRIVD